MSGTSRKFCELETKTTLSGGFCFSDILIVIRSHMLKTLSRICLLGTLFVPLVHSSSFYMSSTGGKAIFFRIFIELSLFFLLVHLVASRNSAEQWRSLYNRLKNPLVIAVGVFTLLFAITALIGVNPTQSWWSNFRRGEGAFQLLHYFSFFLLLIALFPHRRDFEKVLKVHIFVSVVVCLYGASQLLSPAVAQLQGRIVSTLGNPSYLAGYLLLTLPFLLYFLLGAKNRIAVILWGALIFFEVYILFWTQTRAALLALLLGGAIVLSFAIFQARSTKVRWSLSGIALVGALMVSVFIATHNASFWKSIPVINRVADVDLLTSEFAPRFWTWRSAVSGFQDRPILGWGAENFSYPFDRYYDPRQFAATLATEENQEITREYRFFTFDRAHNIFLEHLIGGGVLLLLAWLFIFFSYYRQLLRRKKDFWFSIMITVPVVYLVQGFFFFDTLPIYTALFIFLAFSVMSSDDQWQKEQPHRVSYELNGSTGAIGVLMLGAALFTMYQTSIMPLRKNLLLAQAVATPRASAAFENYLRALEFSSPIGQQETINALAKFELRLFETAAQRGDVTAIPVEQVRTLVDAGNVWFDGAGNIFLGEEGVYWNGAVNIEAGLVFKQEDYLKRGKMLYEDVLVRSPHRLEFVKALMRVARLEGDEEGYQKYRSIADSLRPDIDWE